MAIHEPPPRRRRVLLLIPTTSYKAEDFLAAAERLGVDVVVAADRRQALADAAPGRNLALDFRRPRRALEHVRRFHARRPLDGVVAADDETTRVAAVLGEAMGFRHNPPEGVRPTRDKFLARTRLRRAGLRTPRFARFARAVEPRAVSARIGFPCVVKPVSLSASRGVMRADDEAELRTALDHLDALLAEPDVARRMRGRRRPVLVERFIPGAEVSVEALLDDGRLQVLAIFDKPDQPDGPTFEETLFVTPSRLPPAVQRAVVAETARACAAFGLREGPIHAELRINDDGPWVLEIAARTIGGLCARSLRFGTGISLEELVLRNALGMPVAGVEREAAASGVMMIPVTRGGVLWKVDGVERAGRVAGVVEVRLTAHAGMRLRPPPDGNRYLGFIFARGETPDDVEASLRRSYRMLEIVLGPLSA